MTSVRMDKWLWAARFFKTRALAARACELGRIQSNGQPAKAAREVRVRDMLRVTNDGGEGSGFVAATFRGKKPEKNAQYAVSSCGCEECWDEDQEFLRRRAGLRSPIRFAGGC